MARKTAAERNAEKEKQKAIAEAELELVEAKLDIANEMIDEIKDGKQPFEIVPVEQSKTVFIESIDEHVAVAGSLEEMVAEIRANGNGGMCIDVYGDEVPFYMPPIFPAVTVGQVRSGLVLGGVLTEEHSVTEIRAGRIIKVEDSEKAHYIEVTEEECHNAIRVTLACVEKK
jgi:hypothetical protein